MVLLLAFLALLLIVAWYAFRRGGWPERIVAIAMIASLVAGWAIPFDAKTAYRSVELARLGTDAALWAVIYAVGLRADRYWPIWMAAVAFLAIGIHGVRAYDPELLPLAYYELIRWLSYVMVGMLIIGIRRYDRRNLTSEAGGADLGGTGSGAPGRWPTG